MDLERVMQVIDDSVNTSNLQLEAVITLSSDRQKVTALYEAAGKLQGELLFIKQLLTEQND